MCMNLFYACLIIKNVLNYKIIYLRILLYYYCIECKIKVVKKGFDVMEKFAQIISAADTALWGIPLLLLLIGTGIFLMARLKFLPLRNLGYALKLVFNKKSFKSSSDISGDISPFSALMTALSATIGTGNIVGVATAMVAGGPGALVWMWVCALFGLATKYSECMLSIKYRETNVKGEISGGPMFVMKKAFKNKYAGTVLAFLFAIFTILASFGVGNVAQANSISDSMHSTFNVPVGVSGIIMVILTFIILIGGIQSISKVSTFLVPFMAVIYTAGGVVCVVCNAKNLPSGLSQIFTMAFSVKAVAGGAGGTIIASMMDSMRYGASRGIFSNEAGLGSAAITAAAAKTKHPVQQAYINMTGTFFDTIVVCSITGFVIASSGMLGTLNPKGELLTGAPLTIAAFSTVFGKAGAYFVTISIALFAFSTILGWEYHGEKAIEYLLHKPLFCYIYRVIFSMIVFIGATVKLQVVWDFSDIANGLMAIPNLISLLVLNGIIVKETFDYQKEIIDRHVEL